MTEQNTTTRKSIGWYLLVIGIFLGGIGLFILSLTGAYALFGPEQNLIDAIYTLAEALEGIER